MQNLFGRPVPRLGFGCMRLPETPDELYDVEECQAMFDFAMSHGINYFDSAWHYIDSQKMIGMCLENYPRDSYILVGKLCFYDGTLTSREEAEAAFAKELNDARTSYMDLEMIHALGNPGSIERVDRLDIWSYMRELKASGKARHIGISFHSWPEHLDRILTQHPEIEVVQIQANYYDHSIIRSRDVGGCYEVYEVCRKHHKPFIVMEPVKGGNLAQVDQYPEIQELFQQADPNQTPASWALRYAASLEGALTVLSGMSSLDQMKENYHTLMTDFRPLSPAEAAMLRKVAGILDSKATIACTACRYCVNTGCPVGINIPKLLESLNMLEQYPDKTRAETKYKAATRVMKQDCLRCGSCEKACPQKLEVSKYVYQAYEVFRGA